MTLRHSGGCGQHPESWIWRTFSGSLDLGYRKASPAEVKSAYGQPNCASRSWAIKLVSRSCWVFLVDCNWNLGTWFACGCLSYTPALLAPGKDEVSVLPKRDSSSFLRGFKKCHNTVA